MFLKSYIFHIFTNLSRYQFQQLIAVASPMCGGLFGSVHIFFYRLFYYNITQKIVHQVVQNDSKNKWLKFGGDRYVTKIKTVHVKLNRKFCIFNSICHIFHFLI